MKKIEALSCAPGKILQRRQRHKNPRAFAVLHDAGHVKVVVQQR